MPLTTEEIFSDLPDAAHLTMEVKTALSTLAAKPKSERTAEDYFKAFGVADSGALIDLARLFDKVEAQIAS